MALFRSKIRWTIPGAGTAFSVLHWRNEGGGEPAQSHIDDIVSKLSAYITAIKPQIPGSVSLRALEEVEQLNEGTGDMIHVWTATTPTTDVLGSNVGNAFAAPAGAVISWSTPGIRNSRRVRGRTFVVPLVSTAYENNGTLAPAVLTALNSGANALRGNTATTGLVIYGRPTGPDASDGIAYPATGHRIPDMVAMLTSRRS
jgi:hypothetical protein